MPAFGKNGIVNLEPVKENEQWNVIQNGKVIKTCKSESEAESYKSNLITSGINRNDIQVTKSVMRCI